MTCVRRLDHVHVVFDDDERVAGVDKEVKAVQQTLDVSQVETGGGFVEDVHNMATTLQLAELGSELDTLCLTPRQRRCCIESESLIRFSLPMSQPSVAWASRM